MYFTAEVKNKPGEAEAPPGFINLFLNQMNCEAEEFVGEICRF
jgi:hypothetical protein